MERQLPASWREREGIAATRSCSPSAFKFAPSNPGKILSDLARSLLPGLSLARRLFEVPLRNLFLPMEKTFTLLHTVATAGVFSAVSFWYGFMFGRESARKELGDLIDGLRRNGDGGVDSTSPA